MTAPAIDSLAALRINLGEAMDHSLLNATTERRLIVAAQRGDRHARDSLILHNLRLIVSVTGRYPSTAQLDLFQEGVIGLLAAIRRFDTARNVRFSTLAGWCIRAEVHRAAQRMDVSTAGIFHRSLDDPGGDEARSLVEKVYDRTAVLPEDAVLHRHRAADIRRMLSTLSPQDREALVHWLGDDGSPLRTWVQVGKRMDVSRETARKCVNRALRILRTESRTGA